MKQTKQLKVVQVPIAQLRPAGYNPRLMPEQEMEKLVRSIREFGFVEPLVVGRADNAIIGGHQRWEAAKRLGLAAVPVVYVDVSPDQAKLLNLALNRITGEWDLPRLGELLEELKGLPDLDETLAGFDETEIESLLADLERQQMRAPTKRASISPPRCCSSNENQRPRG